MHMGHPRHSWWPNISLLWRFHGFSLHLLYTCIVLYDALKRYLDDEPVVRFYAQPVLCDVKICVRRRLLKGRCYRSAHLTPTVAWTPSLNKHISCVIQPRRRALSMSCSHKPPHTTKRTNRSIVTTCQTKGKGGRLGVVSCLLITAAKSQTGFYVFHANCAIPSFPLLSVGGLSSVKCVSPPFCGKPAEVALPHAGDVYGPSSSANLPACYYIQLYLFLWGCSVYSFFLPKKEMLCPSVWVPCRSLAMVPVKTQSLVREENHFFPLRCECSSFTHLVRVVFLCN